MDIQEIENKYRGIINDWCKFSKDNEVLITILTFNEIRKEKDTLKGEVIFTIIGVIVGTCFIIGFYLIALK